MTTTLTTTARYLAIYGEIREAVLAAGLDHVEALLLELDVIVGERLVEAEDAML